MAVIQDSSVLPGGLGTYLPRVSVCARGSSLSPPEAGMTDGVCKGGCHMDRNVVVAEVGSRGSSSLPNTHLIKEEAGGRCVDVGFLGQLPRDS